MDRNRAASRAALREEAVDLALAEIDAAIALVRDGHARQVGLSGFRAVERAAGIGVARAQVAGVALVVRRDVAPSGSVSVVVGPRISSEGPAGVGRRRP